MISSNFRGLQYRIFRKIRCFWTVTYISFRFFRVFHVLIKCWSIVYGALEFLYCFCFGVFSIFGRISLILDGSDPEFNTVLMRSPNVFGIFSVQIPRFLVEIYDFDRARREAGQFEVYV